MTTHRAGPVPEAAAETLLDLAEEALNQGDSQRALALCAEVLQGSPEHAGALFVAADAYRDLGAVEEAERAYRRVTQTVPEHAPGWSGLAAVLFDQLRFEQARIAALRALRIDPTNGEACYVRAMLRERRGDLQGADRDFLRAWRLDPGAWPRPVPLTDAMLEAVIEEATRSLHPAIRSYLSQVPFLIEEVPAEDVCRQFDPPAPPSEILGVFTGTSLAQRSTEDPWSQLPATIVLFRRNLERYAFDRAHLLSELRVTIFHEVGHFLGLDEADLEARGLE